MSMSARVVPRAPAAIALACMLLCGCAELTQGSRRASDAFEGAQTRSRQVVGTATASGKKSGEIENGRVRLLAGKYIPTQPVAAAESGAWLRDIANVSLSASSRGVPVSQVVAMLAARGVNITSELPLYSYTYSGVVNATDAQSFLKIVLGTVGLDFVVDDDRRIVVIQPLRSRTWYFNVGRRSTSYSAGSAATGGAQQSPGGGMSQPGNALASAGAGLGAAPAATSAAMGSGAGGINAMGAGSSSAQQSDGSMSVQSIDSFWQTLEAEINSRMTMLVPAAPAASVSAGSLLPGMVAPDASGARPPLPPAMLALQSSSAIGQFRATPALPPSSPESGVISYVPRRLGTYSLNPDTGAVTVQAPTWLLQSLDTYFTRIQAMYNAQISFEGQLILITNNDSTSEGLDLQGFARWVGGKYNMVASSNPLGGVTLSFPTSAGGVVGATANAPTINGPLLGISRADGLRLFNDYLEERSKYSVIQRPALATTSGVPAEFRKTTTRYYNTVSQDTAASTTTAAVATKNVLNAIELGTVLQVNPRVDMSTGMVRTQLLLTQVTQTGNQAIPQSITSGNTTQTYIANIPIVTRLKYAGETLMRDGDLIIVGGQQEDSSNLADNGLPGQNGPTILGGLTGSRNNNVSSQTYYFALQVHITKRK